MALESKDFAPLNRTRFVLVDLCGILWRLDSEFLEILALRAVCGRALRGCASPAGCKARVVGKLDELCAF